MCDNLYSLSQELDRVIHPYCLESAIPVVKTYNGSDWKSFCVEDSRRYKKIKVPIMETGQDFEIFIITWKPGQQSPIHDHATFGCILKVLQGELVESLFTEALTLKKQTRLFTGSIGFMKNEIGVHRVQNNSDITAVSLHVYAPSNHKMKIFTS